MVYVCVSVSIYTQHSLFNKSSIPGNLLSFSLILTRPQRTVLNIDKIYTLGQIPRSKITGSKNTEYIVKLLTGDESNITKYHKNCKRNKYYYKTSNLCAWQK